MDFDKIQVKVGEQVVSENIQESLSFNVDDDNILEKMSKAPARYAYWSVISVVQRKRFKELEDSFEYWKATKKSELRLEVGKTTEKALDEALVLESDYQKQQKVVREAENKLEIIKVAVKAYEKQMQMLQSVGAMRRAELSKLSSVSVTPETDDNGFDITDD